MADTAIPDEKPEKVPFGGDRARKDRAFRKGLLYSEAPEKEPTAAPEETSVPSSGKEINNDLFQVGVYDENGEFVVDGDINGHHVHGEFDTAEDAYGFYDFLYRRFVDGLYDAPALPNVIDEPPPAATAERHVEDLQVPYSETYVDGASVTLEQDIHQIKEDVAAIKAEMKHFATRADLEMLKGDLETLKAGMKHFATREDAERMGRLMIMWSVSAVVGSVGLVTALLFRVLK